MGLTGDAISSNYINSHTQVVADVLTSTTQTCSGNCVNSSDTNIIIIGDVAGDVEIGGELHAP